MGPVGFVTPTKDMSVRPGQYVSGEGRIYHPYLAGWRDDVSCLSKNSFLQIHKEAIMCELCWAPRTTMFDAILISVLEIQFE